MRNDFCSNFLMHHGILGQRWGKKNGPPYPLDAEDHSQSEKKAGYKKSLDGGHNEGQYDRKRHKKDVKKYHKEFNRIGTKGTNENDKETNKIGDKIIDELSKTEEAENLGALQKALVELDNELKAQYGPNAKLVFNEEQKKYIDKIVDAYADKGREIVEKNINNIASAYIKDFDLNDTKEIRDYIEQDLLKQYKFNVKINI